MEKNLPDIDIIIVNYNGMQYIESCLDSVLLTEYPFFRVIMVDNGSTDGSVELVKQKYPAVHLIRNDKNLGFGKANTIGIRAGKTDFIALLNNDTVVDKDWLTPLVNAMLEDKSVAAACSKLLFMDNPGMINGVGGGMNFIGYGFDLGIYKNDDGSLDEGRDVFFPCAAACIIRKSSFDEIGGFDEAFFMYHEDVDLGWRFWLKGYRVKCIPKSVVYHAFGGTSLRTGSMKFRNTLGLRHSIRSLIKNYELRTLFRVLPLVLFLGLRTTFRKRTLEFLQCLLWNLLRLPDTLSKRRYIQSRRIITDKELTPIIWQHIRLPVNCPDYEIATRQSFALQSSRRNFVDMSCKRWKNLGYGWHGTETYFGDGKTLYRWSEGEAVLYLWNKYSAGGILSVEVLGLAGLLKRQRKILVSVNSGRPEEFIIKSDAWEKIDMPYNCGIGPLEVKIKTCDTWAPDEVLKNKDTRRLGVGVKSLRCAAAEYVRPSIDGVSVIIPTYNRIDTLLYTLRSLEKQSFPRERFEVIVVDDGSTDSTEKEVKAFISLTQITVSYLKQANKKQGAARNLGLSCSQMPLIIFIGDDTVPSPDFIEEHVNYHRRKNEYGNLAVIGYTKWPEGIKVTPFMRFIGEYGYQFGYSLIEGEGPLPFNFFYTSNISMLKAFLEELENVFDDAFVSYGWEDIELGYRLENLGMELFYNRKAIAYHFHAVDLSSFCVRQQNVGRASRVFLKMHPELDWFLSNPGLLRKIAAYSFMTVVMEKVLNVMDKYLNVPFPAKLYDIVLKVRYAKGAVCTGSRENNL